jgi:hypothetical protein
MKDSFVTSLKEELENGLSRVEAREKCFSEISNNPGNRFARLMLAKLFYLDSYEEFSIRELTELHRRAPTASLATLLKSFGPSALQYGGGSASTSEDSKTSTHGELDFDFSIFDDDEKS